MRDDKGRFVKGYPGVRKGTRDVKRIYLYCHKEFIVLVGGLHAHPSIYCSIVCSNKGRIGKIFIRSTTIFKKCLTCNKDFRTSIGMEKYNKRFCSRNCKHLYQLGKPNASRTKFKKGHTPFYAGRHNPKVAGKNNWHWKGGHKPLYKQIRDCLEYKQWRLAVFIRDKFICQICFINCERKANADHFIKSFAQIIHENNIDTFKKALNCMELWDISNGRTLCIPCHKETPTFMKPLESHPIILKKAVDSSPKTSVLKISPILG